MDKNIAIVRHVKTNEIYKYLGDNVFMNVRTKVKGNVPTEISQKIFKINIPLTVFISKNAEIENFINKLQLIISNDTTL